MINLAFFLFFYLLALAEISFFSGLFFLAEKSHPETARLLACMLLGRQAAGTGPAPGGADRRRCGPHAGSCTPCSYFLCHKG
jgi:hypothetical protein